jgi:hypothetical protein
MGKIQLTSDEIETIIIKNSHIDRDFRLRYFNLLDYTETDGFIGGHTYSKFKTTPNLNSEKQIFYNRYIIDLVFQQKKYLIGGYIKTI